MPGARPGWKTIVNTSASQKEGGWLRDLLELTRVRITAMVTVTTATGYFLAAESLSKSIWLPIAGVFLLASGSSALNQCQDRRIDARMARTRSRPIPTGRMDMSLALFLSVLLILLGLFVLASISTNMHLLLLLGGFALVWYNGVYTYLKRVTPFAVVPGALIGAIPPIIGYVAAGGSPTSPSIQLLAAFLFIWQIPHFWLLLLMCGSQYGDAGLPTLTGTFSQRQLLRLTFMWVIATAAGGLVFPTFMRSELALPWSLAIVIVSIWLAAKSVTILRPPAREPQSRLFRKAFIQINAYALVVLVCLSLNAVGSTI
jgi:protoheme IX farnesyltransferase